MDVSRRAYAKHRGVSESAVRKAISAGRISVEENGKIDIEKADREWLRNTGGQISNVKKTDSPAPPKRKKHDVKEEKSKPECDADDPAENTEDEEPQPASTMSYAEARTANEIYKAEMAKIELEKLKSTLIDLKQAERIVFRMGRSMRDAWVNWPARVSAELAANLKVEEAVIFAFLNKSVRENLIDIGELEVDLNPESSNSD